MKKELLKQSEVQVLGITLVALVVTIVVLLILAGVTINYVLGDSNVFKKATDAKIKTEIGKIEERAQTIYSDRLIGSMNNNLSTKVDTSDVINQLKAEGYPIKQRTVSADDITGISLDKENMTIGLNKMDEIKVIYEGVEELFNYYIEVNGKYYQIHSTKGFITIDREPSPLTKEDFETDGSTNSLIVTNSKDNIATVKIKENSNDIIEVTALNVEGQTTITVTYGAHTKTCIVTVKKIVLATSIALNENEYTVTGGQSWTNDLQLVATLEPTGVTEKEVTWKSSNPEIATVNDTGLVQAGTKGGDVTITATTKDGTNLSAECKIKTELFGEIKTSKTSYTDSEGNIVQIPSDFAIGTSDNINKVTGGLVIQDNKGNQFVWIPVGNFKNKDGENENITLGRYTFDANGNPTLVQDAKNYTEKIKIGNYCEDMTNTIVNPAKDLGGFVEGTIINQGYYIGRFECTETNRGQYSAYNAKACGAIAQRSAAAKARNFYDGVSATTDLVNSYAWDTAIVFIESCGVTNYANYVHKVQSTGYMTGRNGDKACNIYDMAGNCFEWTTEYSPSTNYPYVYRGGFCSGGFYSYVAGRSGSDSSVLGHSWKSFRAILYLKSIAE